MGQSLKGAAIDVDVRHQRWMADIDSDGSRLNNLSGRMATIADGLSRNPWDLTPELANRAKAIREFRIDEFLDLLEGDGVQPSTLPGHATPTPDGCAAPQPWAMLAALGARQPLPVLLVEEHL